MILNEISFDFSLIDGFATTVALVGYTIVFIALCLLFYLFALVPKIIQINIKKRLVREGIIDVNSEIDGELTGEVSAAISMALHLYFDELHDEESGIITVKRITKVYSPWSSKIYGVTNRLNVR